MTRVKTSVTTRAKRKKYLDKYGQNIKYKIVMEGRKYVLLRGEE